MSNHEHTSTTREVVELPKELRDIRHELSTVITSHLKKLKELGIVENTNPNQSQHQINIIKRDILDLVHENDPEGYRAISIHSEIIKVRHTIDLIENQSIDAVLDYFERQKAEIEDVDPANASNATQRFVTHTTVKQAIKNIQDYNNPHPKFSRIRVLLAQFLGVNNGDKVVVVSESTDTVESLTSFMSANFEVSQLVGQKNTNKLKNTPDTERSEILERFDQGDFEVLITTTDIVEQSTVPKADLAIVYEPASTVILSTNNPNSTHLKETETIVLTTNPPSHLSPSEDADNTNSQSTSDSETPASKGEIKIRVDNNLNQTITAHFSNTGSVTAQIDELRYSDFIISDRISIIRKTTEEFQKILIEGSESFFREIGKLDSMYPEQIFILEGKSLYKNPKIESQAVRSAIGALTIDFNIKVLRTEDESDTARMVNALATRS